MAGGTSWKKIFIQTVVKVALLSGITMFHVERSVNMNFGGGFGRKCGFWGVFTFYFLNMSGRSEACFDDGEAKCPWPLTPYEAGIGDALSVRPPPRLAVPPPVC